MKSYTAMIIIAYERILAQVSHLFTMNSSDFSFSISAYDDYAVHSSLNRFIIVFRYCRAILVLLSKQPKDYYSSV